MTREPNRAMLAFMRMTTFRKLLLVWMIAWLPLSGAMAAVMPFGIAMTSTVVMADAMTMSADQADAFSSAMPCHSSSDSITTAGGTCNHCELCHLAGAIVAPALPQVDARIAHDSPISFVLTDFISFFPEQPQRPPLSSAR